LMMIMMMIFIYFNWVSTRWQQSAVFYKNRKETAQNEKQYSKQYKTVQEQNAQNRKQKYETKNKHKKYYRT
jgi:hypothetical protein